MVATTNGSLITMNLGGQWFHRSGRNLAIIGDIDLLGPVSRIENLKYGQHVAGANKLFSPRNIVPKPCGTIATKHASLKVWHNEDIVTYLYEGAGPEISGSPKALMLPSRHLLSPPLKGTQPNCGRDSKILYDSSPRERHRDPSFSILFDYSFLFIPSWASNSLSLRQKFMHISALPFSFSSC
ncbi:hypothetical protein VNO77_27693 [Canavalia gladiata]|uniref:Uncharacterized protein n=1 Tax=Canavalia gladiata TaxID=3824 RepID=A0AAN9QAR1_CANGL